MVHHLSPITSVGPFVLSVIQTRVGDDGGAALDDSGLRPSSAPASGPRPPWLQTYVLRLLPATLEEVPSVRLRFPDFFLLLSGTSCRAGACPSSLRSPLPPSFAISPQTQQSLWCLGLKTRLSGLTSLRIAHMRALLSPGDPSPALGVGIMYDSSRCSAPVPVDCGKRLHHG